VPRIDGLLQALQQRQAQALVIVSGKPVSFQFPDGHRPLSSVPATSADIDGLLAEILTPEARAELEIEGLARFVYNSPKGQNADIAVEHANGNFALRATLVANEPTQSELGGALPAGASEVDFHDDGSAPLELDDRPSAIAAAPAYVGEGPLSEPSEHSDAPPPDMPSDWTDMFGALPAESGAITEPHAESSLLPEPTPAPVAQSRPTAAPVRPSNPKAEAFLRQRLMALLQKGGSDLHLAAGSPTRLRVHGELLALDGQPISRDEAQAILDCAVPSKQRGRFDKSMSVDFAYELPNVGRFRANACIAQRGIHLTFRAIPSTIPTLTQLGLPPAVEALTQYPNGLILITGAAGCGKSTTQAALLDRINSTSKEHIITIEDPVEIVHPRKKCLINQREVGVHARSFAEALRSALREDPDVILVGELRDLETMQLAITAAETGHLVLGTLHTVDAPKTIDRVIDVFPGRQKLQIRSMVSESLRGVVSQRLIRTADGKGRVAAYEVLVTDRSVANLIREGKTFQIANAIRLGRSRGMCTMDDSLADLVRSGKITAQAAMANASNPEDLRKMLAQPARPSALAPAAPAPAQTSVEE
jgi:twitching motility protein PilT